MPGRRGDQKRRSNQPEEAGEGTCVKTSEKEAGEGTCVKTSRGRQEKEPARGERTRRVNGDMGDKSGPGGVTQKQL